MDMIGRIQRMYSRGKKSEREIARLLAFRQGQKLPGSDPISTRMSAAGAWCVVEIKNHHRSVSRRSSGSSVSAAAQEDVDEVVAVDDDR
jgi:hypothetical protein